VPHHAHRAVVALAQLVEQLEVLHVDVERRAVVEVDAGAVQHGLAGKVEPPRWVAEIAVSAV